MESGRLYLSGIQALVRLPIVQHRRDVSAGLRTRTFVSGYPGSPLAGYDMALQAAGEIVETSGIVHVPAQNEELAATALMGTQMLDDHPHSGVDGVVGIWYGKGPGLDRAGDAIKHGNFAGTSRYGAVVLLSGEDHEAKSSTLPFQEDYAFMSAGIPVLYPSSVAEFLEFGLHAIALSRFSGCWVAMKLVEQLCDGGETFDVAPDEPRITVPEETFAGKAFKKYTDFRFFPGTNIATERHLYRERHAAVRAYAWANGLDRIEVETENDRIGVITAGKSYTDLRQAFYDLGYDEGALRRDGIRLARLGLIYPADERFIRRFAQGLDRIIVVEEKRGVVETAVKAALCNLARGVSVIGKEDERGEPLFPLEGGLDADSIAQTLAPLLFPGNRFPRIEQLAAIRSRTYKSVPKRTPNYCSGCPHNTSTLLLPGQIAWGSPGCHSFASVIEQPQRHIEAITQLGGEGVPWIGLAPFTDRTHLVQNVGDGSLFHSSYLNIRFAVAAGANITFKILYNGVVANTGAQHPVGARPVADLVKLLELEGVKRVAVAHDADELEAAEKELAATHGVTVLIFDRGCANERRRRRKRGKLPPAPRYVVINEEICENCGDCGVTSNCMSLQEIETELGSKKQIQQSSCNQDHLCLRGDCPSFVTIETAKGTGLRKREPPAIDVTIPEPYFERRLARPYHIYVPGVGGTGVLTLNAILAHAAALDGKTVLSYDQTGAAQKWGAVFSSLILAEADHHVAANKVCAGTAELYLALDIMTASDPANLDRCDPQYTVAVVNTTLLPSGEMIRDVRACSDPLVMIDAIGQFTQCRRNVRLDAGRIAESAFGDHMMTNMVTLGAAYQAGLVPISSASIEWAIRLNGVAVRENLLALRYGRLAFHDPSLLAAKIDRRAPLANRFEGLDGNAFAPALAGLDEETRRTVALRAVDLVRFQSAAYAGRYVDVVLRVAARERRVLGGENGLTRAVARSLHKLMAYKDEYEVARLHAGTGLQARAAALFESPAKLTYHLHPPLLRSLGLGKKLRFGSWCTPAFRALAAMKLLRGTPLDPFGYTEVRRAERDLVPWYVGLVERGLGALTPANAESVRSLFEAADEIRGYEVTKLRNIGRARRRAEELLAFLTSS